MTQFLLKAWSHYVRLTARWPSIGSIAPFVPLVLAWWIVTELQIFPRVFLPGPMEVVRSFGSLVRTGILPEYLQDSVIRLAVGAFWGIALGIPLGILVGLNSRAHAALWPLLLFFLLVVQASDVFQYVCGKLWGKHKLSPLVSPSKTSEGLIGGGALAIALGTALHGLTPFNVWQAALMSTVTVVCGFTGGLVLSAVKRSLGAKDWGVMIAGHGGMLDRVDSICLAAPVFFHLTRFFFTHG